jgi:hypothetical protein
MRKLRIDLFDVAPLGSTSPVVASAASTTRSPAHWTMFQVDAEREGARRIERMREDGELVAAMGGGTPPMARGVLRLGDLIPTRAKQRASEWAMLALLTQVELPAPADRRARKNNTPPGSPQPKPIE